MPYTTLDPGLPEWARSGEFVERARAYASGQRIYTGIPPLDQQLRGYRPGFLSLVAGPAHGFKSALCINTVLSNPDMRFAWISPDEGFDFVVQKFICGYLRLDYDDYEQLLLDDPTVIQRAADYIIERVAISSADMPSDITPFLDEAARHFGRLDGVVFDYVETLQVGQRVPEKMAWLKRLAAQNGVAMIAIHQSTKAGLDLKMDPTLGMLSEAGHKEAFQVVWCKRPYIDPDDRAAVVRDGHQPSMEVWILKNKAGRFQVGRQVMAIEKGDRLVPWSPHHDQVARGATTWGMQQPNEHH